MASSIFIRPMHPKTEIAPDPESIRKMLERGWVAQRKVHGHRAQIHISDDELIAYTRQGKRHAKAISPAMEKEIRRLFAPKSGWNVIDGEWLKDEDKLFVFDFIKKEGDVLRRRTFPERWALLPRDFISPRVAVLPVLRELAACLKVMGSTSPRTEGLVFKSSTSRGFSDSSIVRCRIKR